MENEMKQKDDFTKYHTFILIGKQAKKQKLEKTKFILSVKLFL